MGKVVDFPRRPRPLTRDDLILIVDNALSEAERALSEATGWLSRARGAGRARLVVEIADRTELVDTLRVARRQLAGPELALLKGGRDG